MSTKIIEAVRNSLYTQLKLFLKHDYNFKIRTSPPECYNVLMIALMDIMDARKRFKMFTFLLNHNLVDVMDVEPCGLRNVFFMAVQNECYNELDLLMKNYHAEIDWKLMDASGKTILHHAVVTNNPQILELLLRYCDKYKINVDIPDQIDKITPYLLACRLNFHKGADLLLSLGHASKSQADQTSHYDSQRWQQEGQMEKFKSYLKLKEQEMSVAKLHGRVNVYNELNHLSRTLDSEVRKNPDILPILAKVIIDHDNNELLPSQQNNLLLPSIKQQPSFGGRQRQRWAPLSSNGSSPPLHTPRSSTAVSSSSIIYNSSCISSSMSSSDHHQVIDLNSLLKHTVNTIIKQRTNLQSPRQVNSLLEMTNGKLVETSDFVASKSETESTTFTRPPSQHHHHHPGHHSSTSSTSSGSSSSSGHAHKMDLTNVFLAAALEKTSNYRATAKVNNEPITPQNDESDRQAQKGLLACHHTRGDAGEHEFIEKVKNK